MKFNRNLKMWFRLFKSKKCNSYIVHSLAKGFLFTRIGQSQGGGVRQRQSETISQVWCC